MKTDPTSESARRLGGDASGTANTDDHTQLLLTVKQAAKSLSLGERKLWELTKRNAVPSRKIGRLVRYSPRDLAAWIDAGCPDEPGAAARVRMGVSHGR